MSRIFKSSLVLSVLIIISLCYTGDILETYAYNSVIITGLLIYNLIVFIALGVYMINFNKMLFLDKFDFIIEYVEVEKVTLNLYYRIWYNFALHEVRVMYVANEDSRYEIQFKKKDSIKIKTYTLKDHEFLMYKDIAALQYIEERTKL